MRTSWNLRRNTKGNVKKVFVRQINRNAVCYMHCKMLGIQKGNEIDAYIGTD